MSTLKHCSKRLQCSRRSMIIWIIQHISIPLPSLRAEQTSLPCWRWMSSLLHRILAEGTDTQFWKELVRWGLLAWASAVAMRRGSPRHPLSLQPEPCSEHQEQAEFTPWGGAKPTLGPHLEAEPPSWASSDQPPQPSATWAGITVGVSCCLWGWSVLKQ